MKRVYLEITNSCNLNCSFCTNKKGNRFLSYDEVNNYLHQIKPVCNYVYLHILGEPLLHPDFNRILDLLDSLDMELQLVTNGVLLNRYQDLLIHKCLRKLSISVHSINNVDVSSSYFDTLNHLIENNNSKTIELRFYDTDNLDDRILSFLSELNTKYDVKPTKKNDSYILKENIYVYYQSLFKWPDINDPIISYNGRCHGGVDMLAINSNSDVTLCCLDPYAHNKLGNLKENSLQEIMSSDKYLKIVEGLKQNKLKTELCAKCTYRLRFEKGFRQRNG